MVDYLGSSLELVKSYYEVSPVKVVFVKDYKGLPTTAGILNARRGDEIELPRWQARLLKEEGVVEYKERAVDIDYVNLVHYHEVKKTAANTLMDVPDDFYLKVKELVEDLDRRIRENPGYMLFQDRENVERAILQISERRLAKMVRLALSGGGEEVRGRLTIEESLIYSMIEGLVNSWKEYISSLTSRRAS
ncbi:MAG: DNA replication complex GINS family protein [Aeropyrum sp.]|nr:DNA replication complex GINS family protein [Aeropyrum sp.]MCE4615992.1 DNA replication complex GINS family protein [Aeropyrum sp.]